MLVLVLASPPCCIGRNRLLLVLLLLVASMPVLMHMCMKSQSERSSQSKRSKYLACQVSHAECACAGEDLLQRKSRSIRDPAVALSKQGSLRHTLLASYVSVSFVCPSHCLAISHMHKHTLRHLSAWKQRVA